MLSWSRSYQVYKFLSKFPFNFIAYQSFASKVKSKKMTEFSAASLITEVSENAAILIDNINHVKERMQMSATRAGRDINTIQLVAVSKTKQAAEILALYQIGHRHFGENYFQELSEKAQILPKDIQWHFIGHLQSSKAAKLIRDVPNLHVLETVDSEKLAGKLQNALVTADRKERLNIFIQIDTSHEATKAGGIDQAELPALVEYIHTQCALLAIQGIMTIGAPGDLSCFDELVQARALLAQTLTQLTKLTVEADSLQLSMGMSGDFEEAIEKGATSIRVGSIIFGPRQYPAKQNAAVGQEEVAK